MRKRICKCGKIIPENDLCCRKKRQIENNKRWKQKNPEEEKFLSSRKWKKLRLIIIERDNYHCQRCFIKHGIVQGERLEVHHIKSRKDYPELRWDTNNLVTLCKTCNNQLGTSNKLDFEYEIPEEEPYEYKL